MEITNKDQAMQVVRELFRRHGINWTPAVPASDHDLMRQANKFLDMDDRRECAGLPRTRDAKGNRIR